MTITRNPAPYQFPKYAYVETSTGTDLDAQRAAEMIKQVEHPLLKDFWEHQLEFFNEKLALQTELDRLKVMFDESDDEAYRDCIHVSYDVLKRSDAFVQNKSLEKLWIQQSRADCIPDHIKCDLDDPQAYHVNSKNR